MKGLQTSGAARSGQNRATALVQGIPLPNCNWVALRCRAASDDWQAISAITGILSIANFRHSTTDYQPAARQYEVSLESDGKAMKRKFTMVNNRITIPIGISLFFLCLFFAPFSKADTMATQTTNDLVAFFKQAISSPPVVKEFIAGELSSPPPEAIASIKQIFGQEAAAQISTRTPTFHFFEGARSGNNYYLRKITASNSPSILGPSEFISGRAGAVAYQFSTNSVSYGFGTNGMMLNINVDFILLRQFLDMGLGDIEPDSVVWTDDHFTSKNDNGAPRYGQLTISNHLPVSLDIYSEKGSSLIKHIKYTYPDSPDSLAGYPSRIVIPNDSGPPLEIMLLHVLMATQSLPNVYFSDNQFKGPNITSTNIYSNNVEMYTVKGGGMVAVSGSIANSAVSGVVNEGSNSSRRAVIYVLFVVALVGSIIIFGWLRRHEK